MGINALLTDLWCSAKIIIIIENELIEVALFISRILDVAGTGEEL